MVAKYKLKLTPCKEYNCSILRSIYTTLCSILFHSTLRITNVSWCVAFTVYAETLHQNEYMSVLLHLSSQKVRVSNFLTLHLT